jgi:hypothetical protein
MGRKKRRIRSSENERCHNKAPQTHPKSDSNGEVQNELLVRKNVSRMWPIIIGIAATIILGLSGLVGSHGHRSVSIWLFFLSTVIYLFLAFKAYDDSGKPATPPNELDTPTIPALIKPKLPSSASPSEAPAITSPSPTPLPTETPKVEETPIATLSPSVIVTPTPPSAPATPTPESKSDTPSVSEMTAEQVGKKLLEAKKHGNLEPIRKAFVNMRVDWKLLFWKAKYTDDDTKVSAFFIWRSVPDDAPTTDLMVLFELPMKGHERLPLRDKYFEFRIEGIISEVDFLDIVHLKEVRITPNQ